MTLCELATATHHSVPMECLPFANDSSDISADPRNCVEYVQAPSIAIKPNNSHRALSRSAQFWSSYSGYLRETSKDLLFFLFEARLRASSAQLCFAFQRWNDIGGSYHAFTRLSSKISQMSQRLFIRTRLWRKLHSYTSWLTERRGLMKIVTH